MGWKQHQSANSLLKRAGALALSAAIAFSAVPASALAATRPLFTQDVQDESAIFVLLDVVGPSEGSKFESYAGGSWVPVPAGTTAAELTEGLLNRGGITHESYSGEYYYLSSITCPTTGKSYSWDEQTGAYWSLYVNGDFSEVGADQVVLEEGMIVTWYYGLGPNVPYTKEDNWRGYARAGAGQQYGLNTPSVANEPAWTVDLKGDYVSRHPEAADAIMGYVNVSDLITIGDGFVVVVGDELQLRKLDDGSLFNMVKLSNPIDYTARPLLQDGKLIVPEHGGVLEAFDIDNVDIKQAWITSEIDSNQQNSGALVASGGKVFAVTFEYGGDWSVCSGAVICVDVATGKTEWVANNKTSGYYWGGVAICDKYAIVADDAGTLQVLSLADGSVVSTLGLGAAVRSVPQVSPLGDGVVVVSSDGVLHKLAVDADGSVSEVGACDFAVSSTCTPAIEDGYAYVGGTSDQTVSTTVGDSVYQSPAGKIAVIDLLNMEIKFETSTLESGELIPGDVKSYPVVSTGYGALDIYFTANALPGALYALHSTRDSESVRTVFTPASAQQNYCMASPVVGREGMMLYTNDSGTLFALAPGDFHWSYEGGYWYLLDSRGTAQVAWRKVGGSWYVFDDTGKMLSGWHYEAGAWYWLGGPDDGRVSSGWRLIDGKWYYFDLESLQMQIGWLWVEGEWYWLGTSGAMHTGWQFIDGAWYYFDANGHMLRNQVVDGYQLSASGAWIG